MSGTDWTLTTNFALYKPIFNMAVDNWGGYWNDNADVIDAQMQANAETAAEKLPLAGGTMTGALTLAADATQALQPVTLRQLDAAVEAELADAPSDGFAYGRLNASWAQVLPLSGGTLSGSLTVNAPVLIGPIGDTIPAGFTTPSLFVDSTVNLGGGGGAAFNCYTDGTNWFNWRNGYAGLMFLQPSDGTFRWTMAPSGTAGVWTAFSNNLTLTQNGALIVGPVTTLPTTTLRGYVFANAGLVLPGGQVPTAAINGHLAWNCFQTSVTAWVTAAAGPSGLIRLDQDGLHIWTAPSAAAGAVPALASAMTIDTIGNLLVAGNVNSPNLTATTGGVFGAAGVFCGPGGVNSFGFFPASGSNIFQYSPGWYWDWNNNTGLLRWIGYPQTMLMQVDGAGTFTAAGAVMAGANGIVYSTFAANATAIAWAAPGIANFYIDRTFVGTISMAACDEALKENIEDVTEDALATLRQIKMFSYDNINESGRTEVGFIAQQLREHVPEAISEAPKDPDADRDTYEPDEVYLGLKLLPLVARQTRSIQQLADMVDRLTARIAQMETGGAHVG